MKIFTSAQIHELDRYTIEHEPIKSIDLMERAAKAITRAITEEWSTHTPIVAGSCKDNNLRMCRPLLSDSTSNGFCCGTFADK